MWIVSFADLVTLMMSFFVVLYALKQGGEKQQMDTMAAIKATFDPAYEPRCGCRIRSCVQAYEGGTRGCRGRRWKSLQRVRRQKISEGDGRGEPGSADDSDGEGQRDGWEDIV